MNDRLISFGSFELRPERGQLLSGGAQLSLGSRALAILTLLAERAGEIVSAQEITDRVWPHTFVQENNLRVHVSAIRRALRAGADDNIEITNVPGRGYRLSADVTIEVTSEEAADAGMSAEIRPLPPPLQIHHLIGREACVAEVVESIARHRLVTIVGSGGIGKTSVALAALTRLRSRTPVCFVDLTNCTSLAHVAAATAAALQTPMGQDTMPTALVERLRTAELVLMLDNCEHLIDAAATAAEALLQSCPGVTLLATSREPLRVLGEARVHLQPLPVPAAADPVETITGNPSVALFAERAAAAGDFSLAEGNAQQVAAVCRSLDGLPLALELAAASMPMLGLEGLSSGLAGRLVFGRRTLARHETLEAMLDWSFELLSPDERLVLGCLSLFRATFDLAAAAQVAALGGTEETRTARAVLQLATKSLLAVEPSRQGVVYRLLETTKAYARRKLDSSGQAEIAARRHAEWVGTLLDRAQADWLRMDRATWWERYGSAIDDVRAALVWCLGEAGDRRLGVTLVLASAPLWLGMSQFAEYRRWLEQAIETLDALGQRGGVEEIKLQIGLCVLLFNADRPGEQFVRAATQVLRIGKTIGDPVAKATALWMLSGERGIMGDHVVALNLARRMLAPESTDVDADLRNFARRVIALMTFRVGRFEEAVAISAELVTSSSDRTAYGAVLRYDHSTILRGNHGVTLAVQGRLKSARTIIMEAVTDARRLRNPSSLCYLLSSAACPVALWLGDDELARHYVELLGRAAEDNRFTYMAELAAWFSRISELRMGKPAQPPALDRPRPPLPHDKDVFITSCAALCDAEATARAEARGIHWATAEILRADGENRLRAGDAAAGRARFERALAIAEAQGAWLWALRAATSLARLTTADAAARILAPALARIEGDEDYADVRAARALLPELTR
ncbi:winged helix-turn-helix domain-containing protein [Caulobacter segnis]|uniref:ATP-binding protein n=1 Tax=Caulobacter segnis TaxID=88688 RepID=UPI0028586DFD|nr:winged helix-turn-helix domain-containing protein [Caulobacter segnis]MDR6625848.1 putative ATPase/DNA-binding winged helix-turn-helix (wHTH) protein [Caulobacter segnis]